MKGTLSEKMFQELHECEKETMPFVVTKKTVEKATEYSSPWMNQP